MTKRMIAAQLSVGALLLVLVALMESYTGWDTAAQRFRHARMVCVQRAARSADVVFLRWP